jgi:hypothetical protein
MENMPDDGMNENFFKELSNQFMKHYNLSRDVAENFSQEIWKNPEKALDSLIGWYNESLDKAYTNPKTGENNRAFVEMTCGGPHEAIPSAVYNCIGEIYPFLNRDLKNKALKKIFGILDFQNIRNIQFSHTPYIREPLLLSDISISRQMYWPGLAEGEGEYLIKKYNNLFCDFKFENLTEDGFFKRDKVKSDFIVAYSILRSDFCNWGEEYSKIANPNFLNKVISGVVGMRFAVDSRMKALSEEEKKEINRQAEDLDFYTKNEARLNEALEKNIIRGKERLKQLLPTQLHKSIEEKFIAKNWVDPFYFLDHKGYILKRYIEDLVKED